MAISIIKIEDHTDDVMAEVQKRVKKALGLMGEVVEGYAKEDCPVDTGLLRNSITYAISGEKPAMSTYHADKASPDGTYRVGRYTQTAGNANDPCVYVGTNVEYAPYVEFGEKYHHDVGKVHFLRDAGQKHISELKEVAQAALGS